MNQYWFLNPKNMTFSLLFSVYAWSKHYLKHILQSNNCNKICDFWFVTKSKLSNSINCIPNSKHKLCFINKVQEAHVQMINLSDTKGARSVINPINKIRCVCVCMYVYIYIYITHTHTHTHTHTQETYLCSLTVFQHPSTTPSPHLKLFLFMLWVQAKIPSSVPSPQTACQIHITFTLFIIWKRELVKCHFDPLSYGVI